MTRSVMASKVGARIAATGRFQCRVCGVSKQYAGHKRPKTCIDCRGLKDFQAPRRTA